MNTSETGTGTWSQAESVPPAGDPAPGLTAQVEGCTTASTRVTGLRALGAVVGAVLVEGGKEDLPSGDAVVHVG